MDDFRVEALVVEVIVPMLVIGVIFLITSVVIWKNRAQVLDGEVLPMGQRHCPSCGHLLPAIRKPATTRQMLWGGWTCPMCQTEVDRRGRLIASAEGHHLRGGLSTPETVSGQGELSEVAMGQLTGAESKVAFDFDDAQRDADHVEGHDEGVVSTQSRKY